MNILGFSGFIPEQICDVRRFTRYKGERVIDHYCGYAADFISQVMRDPRVDGAVFPRTCDSSRVLLSYLEDSGKFLFQLHIPARRDGAAVSVLRASLEDYRRAVEAHYGVVLDDIPERAQLVNARNWALRGLYERLEELSYGAYLRMIHELLQKPLREQTVPDDLPAAEGGKRVYLVGSFLSNLSVVSAIEEAGMRIVGDRLTESKRLFSAPDVDPRGDVLGNIAASMLGNAPSPTQNDFDAILREDGEEIRRKQVRGVVFVTQKYCEPYDYLYFVYKRMLDGLGIPALRLVLSDTTESRAAEMLAEAFADTL